MSQLRMKRTGRWLATNLSCYMCCLESTSTVLRGAP